MDWLKEWISWLETSLVMKFESSRAARREYSGSSEIRRAEVWMERLSSSLVVAPSYRPPIVLVATLRTSTLARPCPQRWTARTILFTSTGSREPLRLRTCIVRAAVSSSFVLVVCAVGVIRRYPPEGSFSGLARLKNRVAAANCGDADRILQHPVIVKFSTRKRHFELRAAKVEIKLGPSGRVGLKGKPNGRGKTSSSSCFRVLSITIM